MNNVLKGGGFPFMKMPTELKQSLNVKISSIAHVTSVTSNAVEELENIEKPTLSSHLR